MSASTVVDALSYIAKIPHRTVWDLTMLNTLHGAFPGIHCLLCRGLVVPVLCDRLCTGVETHTVQTQHVLVAIEGILITGEREICRGHRNTHIDTHHTAVGHHLKLAGIVAALSEDDRAVGEGVGIHESNTLLEGLDTLDDSDRSEDLTVTDGHFRCALIQDGGAHKVAVLVLGHCCGGRLQGGFGYRCPQAGGDRRFRAGEKSIGTGEEIWAYAIGDRSAKKDKLKERRFASPFIYLFSYFTASGTRSF